MFFDILSDLCAQKGISTYKAAQAAGRNRSIVAKWKTGAVPQGSTLEALADFFGVTTDYLLGIEKEPTPEGEHQISDDDLKFALWGDATMDDEDLADVRRYATFIQERKKGTQ